MNFEFVKNEEKYYEFIRLSRIDGRIQPFLASRVFITKEQQIQYMQKHKDNYYICLCDGEPAGFIGNFNREISPLIVHPEYQKKKVGEFLVAELLKIESQLFALVRCDNDAVMKLVRKMKFKLIGKAVIDSEFWWFIASPGFEPM